MGVVSCRVWHVFVKIRFVTDGHPVCFALLPSTNRELDDQLPIPIINESHQMHYGRSAWAEEAATRIVLIWVPGKFRTAAKSAVTAVLALGRSFSGE